MIRCVRLWTGEDRNSRFEDGHIGLDAGARGDLLSGTLAATSISFQETKSGGTPSHGTSPPSGNSSSR